MLDVFNRIDLKNADMIDGRWYKVSRAVTERCLSELETELVENLPLLDLTKFSAKLVRPYGASTILCERLCMNVSNLFFVSHRNAGTIRVAGEMASTRRLGSG